MRFRRLGCGGRFNGQRLLGEPMESEEERVPVFDCSFGISLRNGTAPVPRGMSNYCVFCLVLLALFVLVSMGKCDSCSSDSPGCGVLSCKRLLLLDPNHHS